MGTCGYTLQLWNLHFYMRRPSETSISKNNPVSPKRWKILLEEKTYHKITHKYFSQRNIANIFFPEESKHKNIANVMVATPFLSHEVVLIHKNFELFKKNQHQRERSGLPTTPTNGSHFFWDGTIGLSIFLLQETLASQQILCSTYVTVDNSRQINY